MKTFFIEITDTFDGEANYSWVTRHKVKASTVRGAICKVARDSGLHWRNAGGYCDSVRYDSASGATCAFVSNWDDEQHSEMLHVNTYLA